MTTSRDAARKAIKVAKARRENPKEVWGLPTGVVALDKRIGGIQRDPMKTMNLLIARPNVGKSAFIGRLVKDIAEHFLEHEPEHWIGVITLEMNDAMYQHRIACQMADVSLNRIDTGTATEAQFERYYAAHKQLASLPIRYHESDSGASLTDIVRFINSEDEDGRTCGLWVLDHIGLIEGASSQYNPVASMADTSKRLQRLSREVSPGLIVAHANRDTENKADKRPNQSSVSGADQLTRDADLILALYREDMYKQMSDEVRNLPKPAELIIVKNRLGPTGTIHMIYDPMKTSWIENDRLNRIPKGV